MVLKLFCESSSETPSDSSLVYFEPEPFHAIGLERPVLRARGCQDVRGCATSRRSHASIYFWRPGASQGATASCCEHSRSDLLSLSAMIKCNICSHQPDN